MDTDCTYFNVVLNFVLQPKKRTSKRVPLLCVWEILIQPLHIWEGLLPVIICLKGYTNNELPDTASPNITKTSVEAVYQHALPKGMSSQNSLLLHDLHHTIS